MTYEDLLEYLSRRPRTKQELVQHFHMDTIDMGNRLKALKAKGQAWVLNIEPLWFKQNYRLRKDPTSEEMREYALAIWYRYDPNVSKRDPVNIAKLVLKHLADAVGNAEGESNNGNS